MKNKCTLILPFICFLGLGLIGCATSGNAIPQDVPTMAEVYRDAMAQTGTETFAEARSRVASIQAPSQQAKYQSDSAYTRTAANEINQLFPTLTNPTCVMYIYPHLAGVDQMPVPGYTTAFSLYDKTYYALPGE
jgi:conjugative transfer region lipoprotein (TIGR03751 family)